MTHELKRKDGRYLDFEEVTVGSVIVVDKDHSNNNWWSMKPGDSSFEFKAGDIWIILTLASRPRCATMRNLQRRVTANLRVDELLELDDRDIITIGPG